MFLSSILSINPCSVRIVVPLSNPLLWTSIIFVGLKQTNQQRSFPRCLSFTAHQDANAPLVRLGKGTRALSVLLFDEINREEQGFRKTLLYIIRDYWHKSGCLKPVLTRALPKLLMPARPAMTVLVLLLPPFVLLS
jgi:hypothetical protein